MNRKELFEAMTLKISKAHERVAGAATMLDPTLIMGWIGQIIEMIRGCRSPETARENLEQGTPITYLGAVRVLRNDGYRGATLRQMANELVAEGKKMKPQEMDALMKAAEDAPPPIAPTGNNSWWPATIMLAFMLGGSAIASEPVSNKSWWPIDIEQNKRLDKLEAAIADLNSRVGASPAKEGAEKNTGICNCQGSNKGVCYCLKSGVQCKCTPTTGSIWNLTPEGKPVGKTGEYANPKTGQAVAKPAVVQAVIPAQTFQYTCVGGNCARPSRRLGRLFR